MVSSKSVSNPNDIVSVKLSVARARLWLLLLAGVLWIVVGISRVVPSWNHPHDAARKAGDILFATSCVILGLVDIWQGLARHSICASQHEIRFEISGAGLDRIRRYALPEISNLRVERRRGFGGQQLAFDRHGRRKFFGVRLAKEGIEHLLDPIYERFPQIVPENQKSLQTGRDGQSC